MRKRQQKGSGVHYLVAVNKKARQYSDRILRRLTGAIRSQGGYYTIIEPESAEHLLVSAREHCHIIKPSRPFPPPVAKRGPVTSLVAAGGDGTVNALATVALEANLPIGILPMGQANNIARSVCHQADIRAAIDAIINRQYRPIDIIRSGERVIVGSFSLGLIPKLYRQLDGKGTPRFAFRWTALASKAAATVEPLQFTIKLDAYRFNLDAKIFSINLLSHTLGLSFSPASLPSDGEGEVIFDAHCTDKNLGQYIRDVYKGRYVYGSEVRLYRGAYISFNPGANQVALVDGDLVELPEQDYSFHIGDAKLNLFC